MQFKIECWYWCELHATRENVSDALSFGSDLHGYKSFFGRSIFEGDGGMSRTWNLVPQVSKQES